MTNSWKFADWLSLHNECFYKVFLFYYNSLFVLFFFFLGGGGSIWHRKSCLPLSLLPNDHNHKTWLVTLWCYDIYQPIHRLDIHLLGGVMYTWINIDGGLVLKLGNGWVISFHCFMWIWLRINALISMLVYLIELGPCSQIIVEQYYKIQTNIYACWNQFSTEKVDRVDTLFEIYKRNCFTLKCLFRKSNGGDLLYSKEPNCISLWYKLRGDPGRRGA